MGLELHLKEFEEQIMSLGVAHNDVVHYRQTLTKLYTNNNETEFKTKWLEYQVKQVRLNGMEYQD